MPFLPSEPPLSKPRQLPTLQTFEHDLKTFVDFGLFFFTLANSGVQLKCAPSARPTCHARAMRMGAAHVHARMGCMASDRSTRTVPPSRPLSPSAALCRPLPPPLRYVGPLTWTVLLSLVVGKVVGVSFLVLLAGKTRCAPRNPAIATVDVAMVGSMASIGLTVALFVSGQAFTDPQLQGEAKLGALLSGLMGPACVAVAKAPIWKRWHAVEVAPGRSRTRARASPPSRLPARPVRRAPPTPLHRRARGAGRRWRPRSPPTR